uniref:TPR_REGION domain-containing protein n=1 Tax=Rhabditophanes sp. KR3021 TaxID=114890 RepID=A0AC35U0L7_9BILA
MKDGKQNKMRYSYAEQLYKMGNYEKCDKVIEEGLSIDRESRAIPTIRENVNYLMLKANVYSKQSNWQESVNSMHRAKEFQLRIVSLSGEEKISRSNERDIAATIAAKMGDIYSIRREYSKAIDLYKEAIRLNDSNVENMASLAKTHMALGETARCQQQCKIILEKDKNNDDATLLLADMMYEQNETKDALLYYCQLLERNPCQYSALARCIELCRRIGDIEKAVEYIRNCIEKDPRVKFKAGYNYCCGLIEWYSEEPNAALQAFYRAKRDPEWGERAIYNMVDICLNPENEIIVREDFESMGEKVDETPSSESENAAKFLQELSKKVAATTKYKIVENLVLASSNNKRNIEKALSSLLLIAAEDEKNKKINVTATYACGRIYILIRQMQKAKDTLKKIMNHPWTIEEAEYLQRAWLLLADIYFIQKKWENSMIILKNVLKYNQSCIKAMEILGKLKEKEQLYDEAVVHFHSAWMLGKQRNLSTGMKLALCLLKNGKHFDCIDICNYILQVNPNYPGLKDGVLLKARMMLRS